MDRPGCYDIAYQERIPTEQQQQRQGQHRQTTRTRERQFLLSQNEPRVETEVKGVYGGTCETSERNRKVEEDFGGWKWIGLGN